MKRKKTDADGSLALAYPEAAEAEALQLEQEAHQADHNWFTSVLLVHALFLFFL